MIQSDMCRIFSRNPVRGVPLLDKVMSRNQWHIRVNQHHLMLQEEGVSGQNISIGSFHASSHNVSIYVK